MIYDVDAIYDNGVLRPVKPLMLPEGARVHLRIEDNAKEIGVSTCSRIATPRLVHPEDGDIFRMEVVESPDADA